MVTVANEMIASGEFFESTAKDRKISDDSSAACEPDMQDALHSLQSLNIRSGLVLTRRGFFVALRRLARIIKAHETSFDLINSLSGLMKSYGRSPYEISLIPGTTYIIEEEKPQKILEIFSELVMHGMEGLCLSRYNPETLHERYNVPEDTVIWLTQKSEPGYRTVDPTNFPRLSSVISDFLNKANYPLILLEGHGVSHYSEQLRDRAAVRSVPEG